MKTQFQKSRSFRFGSVAVLLTALVIASAVLFNTVFQTLATRYSWYTPMNTVLTYDVTEECYALIGQALQNSEEPVKILFCDREENVKENSQVQMVLDTAQDFAARYPDDVKVEFADIWTNPGSVKAYSVYKNILTDEETTRALKSTCVILIRGDYYRVYSAEEFYIFKDGDTSNLWAYNGEKKLAAGILHALDNGAHVACVTNNHGEAYYDSEILYLLDDAGYTVTMLDLHADPIPEECKLILCFNPNTDLIADSVSDVSEIDVLENYLSEGGNGFLVFLEKGTPELPNLEKFLADWGVSCGYTRPNENKITYRYSVQDGENSLTSDGCTVYGNTVATGASASMLDGLSKYTVFKNATALFTAQGFVNNRDGSYTKGNRTLYSLYEMGDSALSYANGSVVSTERGMLMTLTKQTNGDGDSTVGVVASADFCTEDFLQSAVYENTDVLLRLCRLMGKELTPEGLTFKPFESSTISTITTSEMLRWTLALAIIPAALVAIAGAVVLTRRRRA